METNPTGTHEDAGLILALLSGLRIRCCHELWWRSPMWLGCCIAVAVAQAGSTAPIQPLAWELSHATGVALKTNKQTNKNVMKVRSLDFSMGGGVSVTLLIF